LARYDVALAFSNYHQHILNEVGIDSERVKLLHPGVDTRFSPDETERSDIPTLLYVGDLSHHKGYDVFLRALGKIEVDVSVLIAGKGTPDVDLIQSLDLSNTVTHFGSVERQALPKHYNSADLLVVPSVDEMGPNTIVEALACGTPVVATDRPGINEYPPENASVLFSPRTADELADALETALNDLDELTAAATTHAPDFGADRIVKALDTLYRNPEDVTAER